jgi:dCTP deaminase
MILTGSEIERAVSRGDIVISPFLPDKINPNSYNFRLDSKLKVYSEGVIDIKRQHPTQEIEISPEGYVLEPMRLYLACSIEKMGSTKYVPTYAARSSVARLGMFINLSAPLGDIGFVGRWTIQLLAINRVRVYAGMDIGQMMFWCVRGEIQLYDGKYQGANGIRPSRLYLDYQRQAEGDGDPPAAPARPAEPLVRTTDDSSDLMPG